jgi:hypothetical protein
LPFAWSHQLGKSSVSERMFGTRDRQGLPSPPMGDEEYLFQTKSRAFAKRLKRDPHWIAGKQHYVVTTVLEIVPTPDRHEPRWLVRGRPERHDDRCPIAQ